MPAILAVDSIENSQSEDVLAQALNNLTEAEKQPHVNDVFIPPIFQNNINQGNGAIGMNNMTSLTSLNYNSMENDLTNKMQGQFRMQLESLGHGDSLFNPNQNLRTSVGRSNSINRNNQQHSNQFMMQTSDNMRMTRGRSSQMNQQT